MTLPFLNGKMDFGPGLKKFDGKFFSDKIYMIDDYFMNKLDSVEDFHRGSYKMSSETELVAKNFIRKGALLAGYTTGNANSLHDIVYKIKEDIVVVELDENGNDYISYVNVCAPQCWNPTEALGKSISETHQMVPGKLNGSWGNILKACLSKGPYERFQWSIKSTNQLNLHSNLDINSTDFEYTNHNIFIRIETQHITPLIEGKSFLFSILTENKRISTLSGSDLLLLQEAIENMSSEEIKYKRLVEHKSNLLFYIKKVSGQLWI